MEIIKIYEKFASKMRQSKIGHSTSQ